MRLRVLVASVVTFASLAAPVSAQQVADNDFDMSVARPAHTSRRPNVALDEAHNNFHTVGGRYAPWAKLMRNDGVNVSPFTKTFSSATLQGVDVLVISNPVAPGMAAGGANAETATSAPAFTAAECDAVLEWVKNGGSLLLIADHAPFGSAAEILAKRFVVDFGKGFVADPANSFPGRGPTMLVFQGELLGTHAITAGRDSTERVRKVVSFTGQSMSIPAGATALMPLARTAREAANREDLAARRARPAAGRAQGIAMTVGKGRVVMLGEAAMMSAQVGGGGQAMGMNAPGSDDKQFALNVMRWLTGVLP